MYDELPEDTFTIPDVRCIRSTSLAICCVGGSGKERWVPQSVIHEDSFVWRKGDSGKLVVKRWWAEKNGFV